MADLWPLRDALNRQGFKVCSYDMPGIGSCSVATEACECSASVTRCSRPAGHSSYCVKGQNGYGDGGNLMRMVMEAMQETEPGPGPGATAAANILYALQHCNTHITAIAIHLYTSPIPPFPPLF
jgi:hypothetical protein